VPLPLQCRRQQAPHDQARPLRGNARILKRQALTLRILMATEDWAPAKGLRWQPPRGGTTAGLGLGAGGEWARDGVQGLVASGGDAVVTLRVGAAHLRQGVKMSQQQRGRLCRSSAESEQGDTDTGRPAVHIASTSMAGVDQAESRRAAATISIKTANRPARLGRLP